MIDKTQNKMQNKESAKIVSDTIDFFFPEHGITVKAINKKEAEEKLQEIINKK